MKKQTWMVVFLVVVGFSLQGCFYSLQGSGRIIKQERDISPDFNGVRVSNHGDLVVRLGDQVKLTVEGDDNILPHIVTRVAGDTLVLETDKDLRQGWSSRRGVHYYLTVKPGQLNRLVLTSHGDAEVPELTGSGASVRLSSHGDIAIGRVRTDDFKLRLSSHGDVKIDNLEADSLKVSISSHGDVRILDGAVKEQDIALTSHGDYRAPGLASDECSVSNTSHGSVRVWAKKHLKARVTSHGRVYYRGDPEIDASKSSRKKLRRLD